MKSQKPRPNTYNNSICQRKAVAGQKREEKQQKNYPENGHKLKNYLITLRGHWSFTYLPFPMEEYFICQERGRGKKGRLSDLNSKDLGSNEG